MIVMIFIEKKLEKNQNVLMPRGSIVWNHLMCINAHQCIISSNHITNVERPIIMHFESMRIRCRIT